jgi:hypothetical protein
LAPWLSLSSIILTCGSRAFSANARRLKRPVVVAAAEVARADLPDQVAAVHAVVLADRALAGVVREAALLGAAVQRQDGVGRQRAEAHRRDVEHAGVVGCVQRRRPPMVTRKSWLASLRGRSEWLIHS